jgi:hypothetical protein
VYKTTGPDVTRENIQFPIMRALGGEKLDEMGKSWEMIFELKWKPEFLGVAEGVAEGVRQYGQLKGTKKDDGLKVDDVGRKIYKGEEQYVAKEHYMGVTPRGAYYDDWEDYNSNATTGRITVVMSRIPETGSNRQERDNTDRQERTAQDNELIDTVTKVGHPILNNRRPVHKQLEKGGTNYVCIYRARHERYMIDLNYEYYLPINCLERWREPLDCSFYEVPRNPEEAHHRKFGTNGDTLLRDHDDRSELRWKKASAVRSKCHFPCTKIERRNGKRKDNRWEKRLAKDEQKNQERKKSTQKPRMHTLRHRDYTEEEQQTSMDRTTRGL